MWDTFSTVLCQTGYTRVQALKNVYGEECVEDAICERIAEEYGIEYSGQGFAELIKGLKNLPNFLHRQAVFEAGHLHFLCPNAPTCVT